MKHKNWTLRVIIVLIAVLALSAVAIAQPLLQGPDGEALPAAIKLAIEPASLSPSSRMAPVFFSL